MKSVRLSWPSIVFFKLEYIIHPILKPIFNILKFFLVSGLAEADQLSRRPDYSIEILKIFKLFPMGTLQKCPLCHTTCHNCRISSKNCRRVSWNNFHSTYFKMWEIHLSCNVMLYSVFQNYRQNMLQSISHIHDLLDSQSVYSGLGVDRKILKLFWSFICKTLNIASSNLSF
jgi:hypothetical protein